MSYDTLSADDRKLHSKFHARAVSGVDILLPPTFKAISKVAVSTYTATLYKMTAQHLSSSRAVRVAIDAALRICNAELSAPDEGVEDFLSRASSSSNESAVYICVSPRSLTSAQAIIGLAVVDRISSGHFMSCDTGRLIPGPPIRLILGISRIYTAHTARGLGVAQHILNAVCESAVYGMQVPRNLVGWSQPSESGCQLAKKWCSESMTASEVSEDREKDADGTEKKIRVYIER